jgi:rSAM/selenodomain-associated transferase 2
VTPGLSIIIPTLDEEAAIGDLLHDLAPFRAQGQQVVLADGGSRDRTLEIAAGMVDGIVYSARGRAAQMNAGARAAVGDILWFVHADTRLPAGAGERLLQAYADGSRWGRFDVRLSGSQPLLRVIETAMNLRSRVTSIATGDQGIFVARDLFDAVDGFPQIPLMEDVALSSMLRRNGRPACIRRPALQTSSRRWEENGVLRTLWLMWRLRLAYALGAAPRDLAERYR